MLKELAVLAVACICFAGANFGTPMSADTAYLKKQKELYELFWYIGQPDEVFPEFYEKSRTFNIESSVDLYNDKVAHDFIDHYKYGLIPRGVPFSIFNDDHKVQALALFRLLYNARNYEAFFDTAVWASTVVNEMMFTYVLTVATIHRPDTRYIRIPPLYEVFPQLFYDNDVIQQAHFIKMKTPHSTPPVGHHIIQANYSDWHMVVDDDVEYKLNYFTEDVGLNSYYFYFRHVFPFWMTSTEYNLTEDIRGEAYYYGHKHLIARYYLERLSNGLGEIEYFDWDRHFGPGYHPGLTYPSGETFPQRMHWSMIPFSKLKFVEMAKHMEMAVGLGTNMGYLLTDGHKYLNIDTPEGINILGNVIEGNADSVNWKAYGSLDQIYREILGWDVVQPSKQKIVPSALQIFTTNVRDPAFWRIYKRILTFFMTYKEKHHPVYTRSELIFPGVKIESVTVDKLVTFFDHYDSVLNNAVTLQDFNEFKSFFIKARQYRLNHKPFSYHVTVNSNQVTTAVIRVFLGPKYDAHHHELDISDNYKNFYELDVWTVQLKTGINKFERSSTNFAFFSPDEPTSEIQYPKIIEAMKGAGNYEYYSKLINMPERLILPKGRKEGMPFQLFVSINQFDEAHAKTYDIPVWGNFKVDKPWGFPLDRPVYSYNFTVPNMFFKDVVVYHKEMEELNLTV